MSLPFCVDRKLAADGGKTVLAWERTGSQPLGILKPLKGKKVLQRESCNTSFPSSSPSFYDRLPSMAKRKNRQKTMKLKIEVIGFPSPVHYHYHYHRHRWDKSGLHRASLYNDHKVGHNSSNRQNIDPVPLVLLKLNRDFIVASPVKQNLRLILSMEKSKKSTESRRRSKGEIVSSEKKGKEKEKERKQILVGYFSAFYSFLNFCLGHDASRVHTESNAGGTSTISESLSVEYFVRRFQAKDIVTEMEVEYCSLNWKKVDYICTLYGKRVGVSVTRAMSFPDPKEFNAQMAHRLLHKKLFGLVVARHGVSKRHSFCRCILHIWCETQETAKILEKEYEGISLELDIADDVIVVLTVAEGWHSRPIFYESILKTIRPS